MEPYAPKAGDRHWVKPRLQELVEFIRAAFAEEDEQGWYVGGRGLANLLFQRLREDGYPSPSTFIVPLRLLVVLNVLEASPRGTKPPGYKRRFYPERMAEVTDEQVAAAYTVVVT